MLVMSLLITDFCAELLTFSDLELCIPNALWNFYRIKDTKKCLTLMDNPHFYISLPKSLEEYGSRTEINPAENFWQTDKVYVLTDRKELLYVMTDQVTLTFGNFWRSENGLVFKGLSIFAVFLLLFFDVLPDINGRLMGETTIKASLRGTCCRFCNRTLVSTSPGVSVNRRDLAQIITEEYPSIIWECLIGCLSMDGSIGFDLCVCTPRVAPHCSVRCGIIAYFTDSQHSSYSPPFHRRLRNRDTA